MVHKWEYTVFCEWSYWTGSTGTNSICTGHLHCYYLPLDITSSDKSWSNRCTPVVCKCVTNYNYFYRTPVALVMCCLLLSPS